MTTRAVLATAALGIALAIAYLGVTVTSPWARPDLAGSSFYPILVGALLVLGGLGTGIEAVLGRSRHGEEVAWPRGSGLVRLLAVAGAALGYASLLNFLGHLLATVLASLVVLHVMGTRTWALKIFVAVSLGLGSLYLFRELLGIPLPAGIWAS